VGFDTDTKLIAFYAIGKRSADLTHRFMVDLASRLVIPKSHISDAHAFQREGDTPVCQISTDGFAPYPEAVDLAFGPYVKFGTIVKNFRNATMPYTPSEIIGTQRTKRRGLPANPARTICTSHVERNNPTIRKFVKRFARLSLGFSKKLDNLAAAVALHVAHYNYFRRHSSLRMNPAMAAGVTHTLWSLENLIERSQS